MTRIAWHLILLASVISLSILVQAHAEVTSFKTNSPFYKGGTKLYFSGTILDTDPPNVTVLIFDPNDKFVMLASGIADSNHTFQVVVDTSIPANQNSLSVKGVYNATAFIAQKENGKTVNFVFSPDGTSINPSSPTSLTASTRSSGEIDLNWIMPSNNGGSVITGYKLERNNGNGFVVINNTITTNYQDIGLIPNTPYTYRVSAITSTGTSDPSNTVSTTTLSAPPPVTMPTPNPTTSNETSLDELLKQRMQDAQRLQALLHGQDSGGQNTPPQIPPTRLGIRQSANLSENVGLVDESQNIANSVNIQKNNPASNISETFDIKNILYPAISLIGVGLVVTVLYFKKKRKLSVSDAITKVSQQTIESVLVESDDDYAMMVLKNRLAKGEITIDEFKVLKDELSEF